MAGRPANRGLRLSAFQPSFTNVRSIGRAAAQPGVKSTTASSLLSAEAFHSRVARSESSSRTDENAVFASMRVPSNPFRRGIHSSERRTSSSVMSDASLLDPARAPLSVLPLSMIIRSLATTAISSSPTLLSPSLRIMSALAHSNNPLLNPDHNSILRFVLKRTFYAQFCAGENPIEVRRAINRLKHIGFTGVILGYAREVVVSEAEARDMSLEQASGETDVVRQEIASWTKGTLETVKLAESGDFVALKFTGAGRLALHQLTKRLRCSPSLATSIDSICQLAQERGVRLLFDAEQDALQDGIDDWTIQCARKYNRNPETAVIYGTYQAYKKCTPEVIATHLRFAQQEGFSLGVKLVRGAYLGSDPRYCLHDTKEETDACYNGIAASVLTRQWTDTVEGSGPYPSVSLVLATHNADSVRRARAICDAGADKSPIAFAQLQGMADEVSCELVEARAQTAMAKDVSRTVPVLSTYKYLVWGTTGECMKYLLRRAQENKDAVQRTRSGRDAMWAEMVRRFKAAAGLAAH